jgi:hypothetical protein
MKRSSFQELGEKGIALMDQSQYALAFETFMRQAEVARPWLISGPLYNLACCKALLGETESALSWLSKAIDAGYRDAEHIKQDEDFKSLRELPLFQELIAKAAAKPAPVRKCGRSSKQQEESKPQEQPKQEDPKPVEPEPQVQPILDQIFANFPVTFQEQLNAQLPLFQQMISQIPQFTEQQLTEAMKFGQNFAQQNPFPQFNQQNFADIMNFGNTLLQQMGVPQSVVPPQPEPVPVPEIVPEPVVVPETVPEVIPQPVPEVASQSIPEHLPQSVKNNLVILQEMGFLDTKQNLKALLVAKGDVSVAIAKLLAGN